MSSWVRKATRRTDARRGGRHRGAFARLAVVLSLGSSAACASRASGPPPSAAAAAPPTAVAAKPVAKGDELAFVFDSLDDKPVSSVALRGKPTVIAFVATDDLASQAQAAFLAAMAKNDAERVNYVLVAVESPDQRELVEGFRAFFTAKFGVSLRTAMADKDTLLGQGPFGDVKRLMLVVLDAKGKLVWQKTGIAKAEEIRSALSRL